MATHGDPSHDSNDSPQATAKPATDDAASTAQIRPGTWQANLSCNGVTRAMSQGEVTATVMGLEDGAGHKHAPLHSLGSDAACSSC